MSSTESGWADLDKAKKLAALVLGSSNDNESLAAARALAAIVQGFGQDEGEDEEQEEPEDPEDEEEEEDEEDEEEEEPEPVRSEPSPPSIWSILGAIICIGCMLLFCKCVSSLDACADHRGDLEYGCMPDGTCKANLRCKRYGQSSFRCELQDP